MIMDKIDTSLTNRSVELANNYYSNGRLNSYQCTSIDFIRTLIKTGQYALVNFNLKEMDGERISIEMTNNTSSHHNSSSMSLSSTFDDGGALQSFLSEVNYCPVTLSLALNLLISYELSYERKELLKRHLMSNQLFSELRSSTRSNAAISRSNKSSLKMSQPKNEDEEEHNVVAHLHALMQQLFFEEEEKITSWQVRVRLVEFKHLIVGAPLGQLVYCIVEIGDKKFKTKEKQIDALNFEDDDQV